MDRNFLEKVKSYHVQSKESSKNTIFGIKPSPGLAEDRLLRTPSREGPTVAWMAVIWWGSKRGLNGSDCLDGFATFSRSVKINRSLLISIVVWSFSSFGLTCVSYTCIPLYRGCLSDWLYAYRIHMETHLFLVSCCRWSYSEWAYADICISTLDWLIYTKSELFYIDSCRQIYVCVNASVLDCYIDIFSGYFKFCGSCLNRHMFVSETDICK